MKQLEMYDPSTEMIKYLNYVQWAKGVKIPPLSYRLWKERAWPMEPRL